MDTKLQEAINKLPVIQKAHIYEPDIVSVAEISFKAGWDAREKAPLDKEDRCDKCYQQGIKEVVESLKENFEYLDSAGDNFTGKGYFISEGDWQGKLREWGV